MRPAKEPTWTSLALAALRASDDFMDYAMLRVATGGTQNQVSAATHHLLGRRAIGVVVNADGRPWWYARPPEDDDRSRPVDARAVETRPRHRKAGYKRTKKGVS